MEEKEYGEDIIEYERDPSNIPEMQDCDEEEEDDEYLQDIFEKEGFDGFKCMCQPLNFAFEIAKDTKYMDTLKKLGICFDGTKQKTENKS